MQAVEYYFILMISNFVSLQSSGTSSNVSTPGVSRSSTPAPPDHDDEGSDEEEDHATSAEVPVESVMNPFIY